MKKVKEVKFYIPILTKKGTLIMIRADKVKSIKEVLPSKEKIYLYAKCQLGSKNFNTLKIQVGNDIWNDIVRELKVKCNQYREDKCIDLVLKQKSHPLMQIIK